MVIEVAVVVGGTGVVSDAVKNQLDGLIPGPAIRVAGPNRFATAEEVSKSIFPFTPPPGSERTAARGSWSVWMEPFVVTTTESISFGIELPSAPTGHVIHDGDPPTADCPGTFDDPQASPGHLCVYEGTGPQSHSSSNNPVISVCATTLRIPITDPPDWVCGPNPPSGSPVGFADPWGATLLFERTTSTDNDDGWSSGTWAVTAP